MVLAVFSVNIKNNHKYQYQMKHQNDYFPGNSYESVRTQEVSIFFACMLSHSVESDSLQPYGLQPARLLCPWNSLGKNTGLGSHSLLQGIFPTQGLNPGLLHCRQILYRLRHIYLAVPVVVWGILVFLPGVKPTPPAMVARSLRHWTTKESPFSHC